VKVLSLTQNLINGSSESKGIIYNEDTHQRQRLRI
jgi:hypothetical protein